MIEVLTAFALSGLGRLQGSGSVWFLPDWARDVIKHFLSGFILVLFFTLYWVDTSNWYWWHWFLIVVVGGGAGTWVGEGRDTGWLHGFIVRGCEKGSIGSWMKYIPVHKLPEDWQKKLAGALARGLFWSATMILVAIFFDSTYWIYVWAYPIAYALACVWGWCLQEGFNDLNAWTWIEYLRHPLAFALMIQ